MKTIDEIKIPKRKLRKKKVQTVSCDIDFVRKIFTYLNYSPIIIFTYIIFSQLFTTATYQEEPSNLQTSLFFYLIQMEFPRRMSKSLILMTPQLQWVMRKMVVEIYWRDFKVTRVGIYFSIQKGQERYELKVPSLKNQVNTKRKVRY
jgi:hypothetical protein